MAWKKGTTRVFSSTLGFFGFLNLHSKNHDLDESKQLAFSPKAKRKQAFRTGFYDVNCEKEKHTEASHLFAYLQQGKNNMNTLIRYTFRFFHTCAEPYRKGLKLPVKNSIVSDDTDWADRIWKPTIRNNLRLHKTNHSFGVRQWKTTKAKKTNVATYKFSQTRIRGKVGSRCLHVSNSHAWCITS